LALVYLELLGGRKHGLLLDSNAKNKAKETANTPRMVVGPKENRLEPRLHIVSDEELAAHRAYIETKVSGAFWLKHEEV